MSNASECIDVVIPCHERDAVILPTVIEAIREHGVGVNRIIVVSKIQLTDTAEWFPEDSYPFSQLDVATEIFGGDTTQGATYLRSPSNRIGWIYQQFLKLYAPSVIPNLSSNVLILDGDTVFLRPIRFLDDEGRGVFTLATEFHKPYFAHMNRLLGIGRVDPSQSGVAHHMLFKREILQSLFDAIRSRHAGLEPWKAICRCINLNDLPGSCFSEYELYFNFVRMYEDDRYSVRSIRRSNITAISQIVKYKNAGWDCVSCHSHMRG